MEYFLHPSVSITTISVEKIQISSIQNTITIEEQNENICNLINMLRPGLDFPEDLEKKESASTLKEIFELLKDNKFLTTEQWSSVDAMNEDLKLLVSEYKYGGKLELLHSDLDISSVNLMGSGELFNRVKSELEALKFKVCSNPLPDALIKGIIVCCYDRKRSI